MSWGRVRSSEMSMLSSLDRQSWRPSERLRYAEFDMRARGFPTKQATHLGALVLGTPHINGQRIFPFLRCTAKKEGDRRNCPAVPREIERRSIFRLPVYLPD